MVDRPISAGLGSDLPLVGSEQKQPRRTTLVKGTTTLIASSPLPIGADGDGSAGQHSAVKDGNAKPPLGAEVALPAQVSTLTGLMNTGISRNSALWTPSEDEGLRQAVALHSGNNWKAIAATLTSDKTSVQCLHRWRKVLNPAVVKGNWTQEEDDKIRTLINEYGAAKWSLLAKHLPGRIGKQCRERWYNHLDPAIRRGPWSDEENQVATATHMPPSIIFTAAEHLPGHHILVGAPHEIFLCFLCFLSPASTD